MRKVLFSFLAVFLCYSAMGQITVVDSQNAQTLAQALVGSGVTMLNPTLNGTCPATAVGKFNYNSNPSNISIDSGIVLTCGRVVTINPLTPAQTGINAAYENFANNSFNGPGDPDLTTLINANTGGSLPTYDACILEFDFVPTGDSVQFQYVFASEEYHCPNCSFTGSGTNPFGWNFNCSINDVFGFFISGPGYTAPQNIALVPGTSNIMVGVSTVNDGVGSGGTSSCNANTFGNGPYTQYYNDNLGDTTFVYTGYTDVFTALAAVSPCDTYHLKLAIADASDHVYDSGVFLKAGSLTSQAITVKTYGGAGLETPFTNTVRGCPPGIVRISRNGNLTQPLTVPLLISGTATNGIDYQTIPTSVIIPANDSVVSIQVNGIPQPTPQGPESCIIAAISPFNCNGQPLIVSSDTIMIYDSIYVNIINPDTAICFGESVDLIVDADSLLDFHWIPASTVSDSIAQNVTVTPDSTTTYTVSVNLPLVTGCPPSTDHVTIDVKYQPEINLGADVFTCGDAVQLNAATTPYNPDETFSWTPATGLSNPNIRNPIATINNTTVYVVTVNPGAIGCNGIDSIRVTLLPDHINVLNGDTVVCSGTVIQLRTDGADPFDYNWTPEQYIANDTLKNTTLTAIESGYYTLTASFPGCLPMPDSFYLEVQPVPQVDIGFDRVICTYDTIQFFGSVLPENYPSYSYLWQPGMNLSDSTIQNPVFNGDNSAMIKLEVKTPIGCTGSDSMRVTVHPGDFLRLNPGDTGICPPAGLQLLASGAQYYTWTPTLGLNLSDISNPFASPLTGTEYQVIGQSMLHCFDTQTVYIDVYPSAVVNLPDTVTIWPGESYQMMPGGNALYFSWFPPSGLSADDISNPIASPEVRTRYFITARTENGCVVKDSIDVLVNTESILDLPNAFTAGQGINGIFKIIKRGIATLHYFRVYNRWGNKVFETTDINKGWDGTFNGVPQPAGVYVYDVTAVTSTGKEFHKAGDVTLIR